MWKIYLKKLFNTFTVSCHLDHVIISGQVCNLIIILVVSSMYVGQDYGRMSLEKLNELEDDIDEEDEKMFEEYRFVFNLWLYQRHVTD